MHKYYQNKRVSNINNPPIMYNNNNANISMKIKAQNKLNLYNKGMFSINSITNHSHITDNHINYNRPYSTSFCCNDNGSIKTSVKTYSAMHKTRSKNDGSMICNSINSFECYKNNNLELIENIKNGNEILKHDNGYNKSSTIVIKNLTNNCYKSDKTCKDLKSQWEQHLIDNPPCSKADKIKYCIIAEKDFCSSKVMDHSDYLTKLKDKKTCDSSARYFNHTKQGPCF
tara:strand:+ start:463 stop:1146 length:684 start_codon:yes stop_codon:yes gene_type:complete